MLASHQLERCTSVEYASVALRSVDAFLARAPHAALPAPTDVFSSYEDVILSDTRSLLQQVLLVTMCQRLYPYLEVIRM